MNHPNTLVTYTLDSNICRKPADMTALYSYDTIVDTVFHNDDSRFTHQDWISTSYVLSYNDNNYMSTEEPTIENRYSLLHNNDISFINAENISSLKDEKVNIWDSNIINIPKALENYTDLVNNNIDTIREAISSSSQSQQLTLAQDAKDVGDSLTSAEVSIIYNITQQLYKLIAIRLNKQVYDYIAQNASSMISADIVAFLRNPEEVERAFYFDVFNKIVTADNPEYFHLLVDVVKNIFKTKNLVIISRCMEYSLGIIYNSNRQDKDELIHKILSDKNVQKYISLLKKHIGKSITSSNISSTASDYRINIFICHVPQIYTFMADWYKSLLSLEDIASTNTIGVLE